MASVPARPERYPETLPRIFFIDIYLPYPSY